MAPLAIVGLIVLVVIVALIFLMVSIYNTLVRLKNRFQNAFSQIEVQLKRRHDLIPNLVETVKGYMGHEKGTLEAVIQARNMAVSGLQKAASNPGDAKSRISSVILASSWSLCGVMVTSSVDAIDSIAASPSEPQ